MPINLHKTENTKQTGPEKIFPLTRNSQNKEKILKTVREKDQATYIGRPIRITLDFLMETLKAEDPGQVCCRFLREHRCQPRQSFQLPQLEKIRHSVIKNQI